MNFSLGIAIGLILGLIPLVMRAWEDKQRIKEAKLALSSKATDVHTIYLLEIEITKLQEELNECSTTL